jgi:hypothetical protein
MRALLFVLDGRLRRTGCDMGHVSRHEHIAQARTSRSAPKGANDRLQQPRTFSAASRRAASSLLLSFSWRGGLSVAAESKAGILRSRIRERIGRNLQAFFNHLRVDLLKGLAQ